MDQHMYSWMSKQPRDEHKWIHETNRWHANTAFTALCASKQKRQSRPNGCYRAVSYLWIGLEEVVQSIHLQWASCKSTAALKFTVFTLCNLNNSWVNNKYQKKGEKRSAVKGEMTVTFYAKYVEVGRAICSKRYKTGMKNDRGTETETQKKE